MRRTMLIFLALITALPAYADDDLLPVFRLRRSDQDWNYLTTSCQEKRTLVGEWGWHSNGVLGYAPAAARVLGGTNEIMHFSKDGGSNYWSSHDAKSNSDDGKQITVLPGFSRQPGFFVYNKNEVGSIALRALWKGGVKFYSTDKAEIAELKASGWGDEFLMGYIADVHLDFCPTPDLPGFGGLDFGAAVSQAVGDLGRNFSNLTGPAWEHVKHDIGPAINEFFLHVFVECRKSISDCTVKTNATATPEGPLPDPSTFVTGNQHCHGPDGNDYAAGTVTYMMGDNRDEYVCSGHDDGTGNADWIRTGRRRTL